MRGHAFMGCVTAAVVLLTTVGAIACPLDDVGSPQAQPAVAFSANNQSAKAVLGMLLPKGWALHDEANTQARINVSAHTPWRDTLASIAEQSNRCVELDWDTHTARLHAPGAPAIDTSVLTQAASPATSDHSVSSVDASALAPLAPPPQGMLNDVGSAMYFDLHVGETLRGALTRWAQQAGWAIVWQTDVDYPIQATAQFPAGTSFKDAVRQTMQAFWQQTRWLRATVYSNHVVVIEGQGSIS